MRGVVFGGSSGIGAAVARLRAAAGDAVLVAGRRGIVPPGCAATGMRCDVRSPEQVAAVLTGPADWVVNAAGVGFYAPVAPEFATRWSEIVDTNVVGLLNLLAALGERPPIGQFVHISSLAALRPSRTPGNDVYAASKAAGAALVARYRAGLRAAGHRTRVSVVSPGYVGGTDFEANFYRDAPVAGPAVTAGFPPLTAADVASVVDHALSAPAHLELSEIVVRPIAQPD